MFTLLSTVDFGFRFDFDHVIISPSTGSTATTAGETDYSLTCSATLFDPNRLPSGVPLPLFQWSFQNGSASFPSGVIAMATVLSSSNSTSETYSSVLQFSLLNQFHTGMYTCRLGPGRLVNSALLTVNCMIITWPSIIYLYFVIIIMSLISMQHLASHRSLHHVQYSCHVGTNWLHPYM